MDYYRPRKYEQRLHEYFRPKMTKLLEYWYLVLIACLLIEMFYGSFVYNRSCPKGRTFTDCGDCCTILMRLFLLVIPFMRCLAINQVVYRWIKFYDENLYDETMI